MKKMARLIILGLGLFAFLQMNPLIDFVKRVWANGNGGG